MNIKKLLTATLLATTAILATGCASYGHERTASAVVSDSAITTKVKAALLAEKDVNSMDISVNTFNGVVQLSGFVTSQWQVDRAIQVAAAVGGVRSVKNDLAYKAK